MIYICVPSYNEEQTIGVLLWKFRQVMAEFRRDYHVLVLDDGSTDRTQEVLEPYLRIMPLTVIRHGERQGYARALERLVREAVRRAPYPKRDCVLTLQADFTDEPEEIPALVKRIEGGVDVVSGRAIVPPETPRALRWTRRGLRLAAGRLRRWPAEISDPLSGFRAYRVVCLRKMFDQRGDAPLLRGDGWTVNAELLEAVVPHARQIEEVDVAGRWGTRRRKSRIRTRSAVRQLVAFLRDLSGADVAPRGRIDVEEVSAQSVTDRAAADTLERTGNGQSRAAAGGARGGRKGGGRKGSGRKGGGKGGGGKGGGKGGRTAAARGGEAGGGEARKSQRRRRRGGRKRKQGADAAGETQGSSS